jgi:hypothetical protein
MKALQISILTLGILCFFAFSIRADALGLPTKSFGGTVLLSPIPGVTCYGIGRSLFLSSNIKGLIDTVSAATSNGSTGEKAAGVVSGILKLIPTYANDPTKIPRMGKQILGNEKLIPNFTKCSITAFATPIPIPVYVTTDNYGVSKRSN